MGVHFNTFHDIKTTRHVELQRGLLANHCTLSTKTTSRKSLDVKIQLKLVPSQLE
jgi:hypothetical protein